MQQNWISTRNFVTGADSIEILVKLFKNYKAIWFLLSKVLFLGQKSLVSYQHLDFCTKLGANIFCQLSKKISIKVREEIELSDGNANGW